MSLMLMIDGYKLDHRRQYPAGTEHVYSNWTPRSSRIEGQHEVVFFGLQYFLKRYMGELFDAFVQSDRAVRDYGTSVDAYLGPNDIGTDHIRELRELGYLPLEFRALPEGTLCPLRVPTFTVENTHPRFAWLVNYFETILSNVLWMPCTSATTAYRMRKMLNGYAERTGGDPAFVPWQGHDFSMRGLPGIEASMLSGAAHLLSFKGTDTIPAIGFLADYYGIEPGDVIGGSVPATEHSVMSAGGETDELSTFNHLLGLYPRGAISVVSDTWDLWHVLTGILPQLKAKIMARDGKIVIRPDSGDPVKIICGDPEATGPAKAGTVELLWNVFGGTTTSTGHRLLDPHVGVIYGDSINYDRCKRICEGLATKGYATTNMVFGIGSFTYQYVTRDTFGFAMKATWAQIEGQGRDLFKKPVTDDGTKFSAAGRLAVERRDGRLAVIERATPEQEAASLLRPVWRDGRFLASDTLTSIRRRLWEQ